MKHDILFRYNALDAGSFLIYTGGFSSLSNVKCKLVFIFSSGPEDSIRGPDSSLYPHSPSPFSGEPISSLTFKTSNVLETLTIPIITRDHALLARLRTGDRTALDALQRHYTKTLFNYVYSRIEERETTHDIIQEIFLSMWSKRETLVIEVSLRQYLFGAAKYKVLDYRRFVGIRKSHALYLRHFLRNYDNTIENRIQIDHIMYVVESTLSTHAQRAQDVFRLSRFEHLSVRDIAMRMNISHRTVENYISTVLTSLRPLLTVRKHDTTESTSN